MTRIHLVFFMFILLALRVNGQQSEKYLARPLPREWQDEDSLFQQVLPVDDKWWRVFEDETLDSLIALAIDQNPSVLMAINRIDQAKAQWRISQSELYPSLSFNGAWNRQQTSGYLGTGNPQNRNGYYSASVQMSWQLDVFGVIRQKAKAQKELYNASKEEYNATMVSLCAEIALVYFNLREQQLELDVLRRNAASQETVVAITEARYKTGLVSKLDVAQSKSVYYSTLASIPMTEANVIQYINSLAILLGLYPQDVTESLSTTKPLPDYVELVGVGVPSELLLRRPDVRVAERQVNAQATLLGASKFDWLPEFFVNGSLGYSSHDIKNMGKRGSMTWSIAPSMTWNIFSGGRTLQEESLQRAQLDESINQFNQIVLTAVQEVDNAMSAYKNSIKQIQVCKQMLNQGKESFDLSLDLYKQGLTPFQNVLDAQRSLLTFENTLVKAKGNSLVCLVQMYQALGGGW